MLFNHKFKAFGNDIQFFIRTSKTQNALMWGCGNRTSDGKYVLFLDYDDTPEEWIREEVRLLQHEHPDALSTAYLFKTLHGYHVVFLEKHYLGDIIKFLDMTSCDRHYKNIPMQYGRKLWVLRQSKKKGEESIKYLGPIHNTEIPFHDFLVRPERSNAHRQYLRKMFDIPAKDFPRSNEIIGEWDEGETLTFGYYHINEG